MKYVYVLRSENGRKYIGITSNLKSRLIKHNAGEVSSTKKFRPWSVETYVAFCDESKAYEFEKYLKTGAGWAFLRKRL